MIHRVLDSVLRWARRPLAAADAAMNRLYTWRFNPLYQTGTLVVLAFVVMLVSGLYLLLFYRIGSPYESVARIEAQVWTGQWLRAIHRYSADLAVAAGVLHAFRMLVQGRSWGPRTLAWVSGWVLMFLTFVCGWTGYVMLWDEQGQLLALEGARLLDALPLFSEPIRRAFVGDRPVPNAFFFLNLFLHVALPVAMALVFWIHLARVARPVMLPPRGLLWGTVGLLFVASVLVPAPLGPKADLLRMVQTVDLDWFYAFWLPASRMLQPVEAWIGFTIFVLLVCLTPLWARPPRAVRPEPSVAAGRLCTGCDQCTLDCPYEAIEMAALEGAGLDHLVARVDPKLCVSCGICSASCAPMAIGPPDESGRDELVRVTAYLDAHRFGPRDVVLVACENGAGRVAEHAETEGASVFPVSCIGHLHTSVIEYLLRAGVGGVLVASCPPRDCWHREGPKWLEERIYAGREAELRESIDRRRIAVVYAAEVERGLVGRALAELRNEIEVLEGAQREEAIEIDTECEPRAVEGGP
jgi:coenzyme F420-reducing hydrogenase delta subunit/Pyruvate/2-oxoacid:ferredoxin oxidoreductase delta subunit